MNRAVLILAAALLVAGCSPKSAKPLSFAGVGALERVKVRQSIIADEAKHVLPKDAGQRITKYANESSADADQAGKVIVAQDAAISHSEARYAALEGKWYVRYGRLAQTVAIVLVAGWAAVGLFGAYFVGTPGLIGWLARHAMNFLPFANPFTAIARKRQVVWSAQS